MSPVTVIQISTDNEQFKLFVPIRESINVTSFTPSENFKRAVHVLT